jgi:hypothetical protein
MNWPGIYRVYNQSAIILADYDYLKKKIGPFVFPHIYAYSADYVSRSEDILLERYTYMFEEMLKYKALLAVVLVNSEYYMKCFTDRVDLVNRDGYLLASVPGHHDYTVEHNEELIPVGFEKTYCAIVDVLITPARIYYSNERKAIFFKNEWIQIDYVPTKFTSKSLYKDLVENVRADGVIQVGDERRYL